MSNNKDNRWKLPSLFVPLLLISIGVVILLNNLGVIEGERWENIFKLWPLLLIVIGLDGLLRGEGMIGATFMIGIGSVFLLANLGYLALDVWVVIIRLWPLLLIAIGFDILLGRRSRLGMFIGMVAILAVLFSGLWYFGLRTGQDYPQTGEKISQPLYGIESASIFIEPGAGDLRVRAHQDVKLLLTGSIPSSPDKGIQQEYSVEKGKATFVLKGMEPQLILGRGVEGFWRWDLALNSQIPIELTVGMGAGRSELNLSDLFLSELEAKLAVGNMLVRLPEGKEGFHGAISGAIGRITIIVPKGVALRIRSNTGLANINVPKDYLRDGNVYTSPEYKGASQFINLDVNMAIGLVSVRMEGSK